MILLCLYLDLISFEAFLAATLIEILRGAVLAATKRQPVLPPPPADPPPVGGLGVEKLVVLVVVAVVFGDFDDEGSSPSS
jgi:hypothetical protein